MSCGLSIIVIDRNFFIVVFCYIVAVEKSSIFYHISTFLNSKSLIFEEKMKDEEYRPC